MEEHVNFITRSLNDYLGPFALSILTALHIKPSNPELPIPQHVAMGLVVLVIGTAFALVLRSRLSAERPGALQQVAELLITNPLGFAIRDLLEENTGHGGKQYIPFVG